MKITRRHLRRLIKEQIEAEDIEISAGSIESDHKEYEALTRVLELSRFLHDASEDAPGPVTSISDDMREKYALEIQNIFKARPFLMIAAMRNQDVYGERDFIELMQIAQMYRDMEPEDFVDTLMGERPD